MHCQWHEQCGMYLPCSLQFFHASASSASAASCLLTARTHTPPPGNECHQPLPAQTSHSTLLRACVTHLLPISTATKPLIGSPKKVYPYHSPRPNTHASIESTRHNYPSTIRLLDQHPRRDDASLMAGMSSPRRRINAGMHSRRSKRG
jgi:hypothetical protein